MPSLDQDILTKQNREAMFWDTVAEQREAEDSLLQVYRQVQGRDAPPCTLLAIRGERFGLGEPLSAAARQHLAAALRWACAWVDASADAAGNGLAA